MIFIFTNACFSFSILTQKLNVKPYIMNPDDIFVKKITKHRFGTTGIVGIDMHEYKALKSFPSRCFLFNFDVARVREIANEINVVGVVYTYLNEKNFSILEDCTLWELETLVFPIPRLDFMTFDDRAENAIFNQHFMLMANNHLKIISSRLASDFDLDFNEPMELEYFDYPFDNVSEINKIILRNLCIIYYMNKGQSNIKLPDTCTKYSLLRNMAAIDVENKVIELLKKRGRAALPLLRSRDIFQLPIFTKYMGPYKLGGSCFSQPRLVKSFFN